MDGLEAILTRRSIRKYNNKPVDDKILLKLIQAAVSAPSAGNQQPWQFIIIRNKTTFDNVLNFHPHAHMLPEAQAAILICGDLFLEKHKGFWMIDCSAATQNLLLAAHAYGLGACWLGIFPRADRIKGMIDLLALPKNIIPFALISIGYPGEKKDASNRFDPTLIHYEKW
jgi:nitroreductase